jgi:DNA-binding NtrC family response regulator
VRELENVIQKAVVMAPGDVLLEDLIPPNVRAYAQHLVSEATAAEAAASATPGNTSDSSVAVVIPEDPHEYLFQALTTYADAVGPNIGTFTRECERLLIIHALNRERGVKLRAARALGINRVTLDRKLAEYHIDVRRGEGVIDTKTDDARLGT